MYFALQLALILIISLVASMQDIWRGQVSDFVLWGGTILMIICNVIFLGLDSWTYIAGGIFTSLIFLLARILTKGKLGFADVYFAGFAGVSLHWRFLWIFVILSCASAGFVYFCRFAFSRKKFNTKISFIPFLSLGLIIAKIVNNGILH